MRIVFLHSKGNGIFHCCLCICSCIFQIVNWNAYYWATPPTRNYKRQHNHCHHRRHHHQYQHTISEFIMALQTIKLSIFVTLITDQWPSIKGRKTPHSADWVVTLTAPFIIYATYCMYAWLYVCVPEAEDPHWSTLPRIFAFVTALHRRLVSKVHQQESFAFFLFTFLTNYKMMTTKQINKKVSLRLLASTATTLHHTTPHSTTANST